MQNMAAIAQLGERQTEDLKVPGSIPGLGIFGKWWFWCRGAPFCCFVAGRGDIRPLAQARVRHWFCGVRCAMDLDTARGDIRPLAKWPRIWTRPHPPTYALGHQTHVLHIVPPPTLGSHIDDLIQGMASLA